MLVGGLVIHMWRTAPHLKQEMENHLSQATEGKTTQAALWGVFFFTVFMITREGMEMVLLLLQIHTPQIVAGIILGILAAAGLSLLWVRFSRLINLGLFFQVTSVFLLLFVAQILLYSFHEFTEAGILPYSEVLHAATEPFSAEGRYGRWISLGIVIVTGLWLAGAWMVNFKIKNKEI